MNIPQLMERVLPGGRGHVPSVPNLRPAELKTLRQVFELHDYAGEPSSTENSAPVVLKTLFARGLSVSLDSARETFQPLALDRLIESGLLYEEHDEVKAHFQAQPYSGLILFSDFFQWESHPEFVLPIGPAGNYLALLTIRRPVEATLDLGCGCGIQSLLAARHSTKVIATDINPRALALTRLNAGLNDMHNIETRRGSYFEPVRGRRFDLIVANLPYVITPERRLVYRTVDRPGDAGLYERVNEIPDYLAEGGFAQLLINWVHAENQHWSEPIHRAMSGRGMDAWLIHNGSKTPDEYARMWLNNQARNHPGRLEKTRQSWLRWYRRQHMERIALGALILRRRSHAQNWFCSATVDRTLAEPASEQFLRLFAAQDYLSRIPRPDVLLNRPLSPVDLDFAGDEGQVTAYSTHGSRFEVKISQETRAVLQKAAQPASYESGLEAGQVQPELLADITELVRLGMLLPAVVAAP